MTLSSPPTGSTECEWSDSGSDVRLRKFPSLLHGKRSAPELPLLPPATRRVDQSSPTKRDEALPVKRKPLPKSRPTPRSPRRFSFDLASSSGFGGFSEDEGWNRRRSERIFLHDATVSANQMSVSASTPSTSQSSSSSSTSLAPPLTPKAVSRPKPTQPSRDGKDVVKVCQEVTELLPAQTEHLFSHTFSPSPLTPHLSTIFSPPCSDSCSLASFFLLQCLLVCVFRSVCQSASRVSLTSVSAALPCCLRRVADKKGQLQAAWMHPPPVCVCVHNVILPNRASVT